MSLKMNFSTTAGSRAVYALSQWLLLVFVARLTSPEQLGEFTYALAVVSPLIIFAQLNMRSYMATDSNNKFMLREYLYAQYIMLSAALVLIVGLAWTGWQGWPVFLVTVAVGLYKSIESISGVHYGALQRDEQMSQIAISVVSHGVMAVAVMASATASFGDVVYGAWGIAVVWAIILFAYDAPQSQRLHASHSAEDHVRLTRAGIWRVITCCLPLGIVLAMLSLRINIPVYFIQATWSSEQVGFYSAIAYFVVAGNMITGSLLQAAAPRLANHHRDGFVRLGRTLYIKLTVVATSVGAIGVFAAWGIGRPLLEWVYGAEYARHHDVLVWVMVAAAVMYMSQIVGLALTVSRSFRCQVIGGVFGIVVTLGLCAWLVPNHGLIGASQALVGGSLATLLANMIAAYLRLHFLFASPVQADQSQPDAAP